MESVATECAQKTTIDYDQITACTHSRLGNQLQHAYAVQTESLQPPHQYVPWITLNGEHTEDMQKQAEKDLIGLVCKSYQVIGFCLSNLRRFIFGFCFCFRALIHLLNVWKTYKLIDLFFLSFVILFCHPMICLPWCYTNQHVFQDNKLLLYTFIYPKIEVKYSETQWCDV